MNGNETQNYNESPSYFGDVSVRIKDLEERQRILKDRLLLIGENLIEIKEETEKKILSIKKDIELLKQNTERLISFIETASKEFSKFARKDDLNILSKQIKIFGPLKSTNKKDSEKKE